jgi:hypothetical protein
MKKATPFLLLTFLTGCSDEAPLSPQAGPPRPGMSMRSGPRDVDTRQHPPAGPFFLREPDPKVQGPVISRSFDAVVLEKHEKAFLVEGTSGRKYVLIPDECFVTKPASELPNIKYEQLKVRDTVTVHLTAPVFPFSQTYVCLCVDLHGVKRGGMDLTPRRIRPDDLDFEK